MNNTPETPTAEFLDPHTTRIQHSPGGSLQLRTTAGEWDEVQIRLVFPLTPTERMAAFLAADDTYVGTVSDYRKLDLDSCRVVEDEIALQYFRPAITRIEGLRKRFGLVEMDTQTEAGPRLVRFRSARDDVREISPGRFLLTDATGNRFEIPCLDALDEKSRQYWHNLV